MGCASSTAAVETPSQASPESSEPSEETGFFGSYALGVKLGKGAFGQVRLATRLGDNQSSKESLAVKILDLRDKEAPDGISSSLQKSASTEASLWLKVRSHANIVGLKDVFYDDVFCYFLMEKCTSSLFAHLESISDLNERSLGSILSQMLVGLEHVHSAGVVHRDVKPDNFLVGGVDGATLKLCDFGLSADLPSDGRTKGVKGVYGTAPFMCPEMIKGKYYDDRADVWSVAVVSYTLLFGNFPYFPKTPNSKAMKQAIVDGKPPTFEPVAPCLGQKRSDSAVNFVKVLLERSPDKRLCATDALQMPYMVASREGQHMVGEELPSLRPMVYTAKKAGAFEIRDLTKESDIDQLLNKKQQESQGVPLPEQTSADNILGKTSGGQSKNNAKSGAWQTAPSNISLNSKVWDNTSSFATTASGNSSITKTSKTALSSALNSKAWDNTSSFATTASGTSSFTKTLVPSGCPSPTRMDSGCSV